MIKKHLSSSAYKSFKRCAAKQKAIDLGMFEFPTSQAFLEGQYLEHLLTRGESPCPEGILKKDGSPYASMVKIKLAAERALADEMIHDFLQGNKQLELKFKLEGVDWISIPDIVDYENKRIVDIKKTKSITEEVYSQTFGCRVPFWTEYDYFTQLAIAREAVMIETGEKFDCYLLAVSMETPADFNIIQLKHSDLDESIDNILRDQEDILAQRSSKGNDLLRCEKCDYCRSTRTARIIQAERIYSENY